MTTDNQTTSVALADAPSNLDDPRVPFAQAVALGTAVIGRVGPSQLANPTPCTDFDVRALLDHMVMVLRRVAAIGRADDAFGRDIEAPVEGDAWQQAWLDTAHAVEASWSDDSTLTRTVRLPWVEDTGAAVLVTYLNEVIVHTWDLARATGQRPAWDPDVVRLAFEGIRGLPAEGRAAMFDGVRATMPAEQRDFADPFADAVPVADDAALIDRLVAWNGRRP